MGNFPSLKVKGKKCGGLGCRRTQLLPYLDKGDFQKQKRKETEMTTEFFMPMHPPTVTHHDKKITVKNGKAIMYDSTELKAAKEKLTAHLAEHIPQEPYSGAVRLMVKWCFSNTGTKHGDGEWKTSKPDTDNLEKALKDCMTRLHFWKDDAQVASEISEKFWAAVPGIYVRIEELPC